MKKLLLLLSVLFFVNPASAGSWIDCGDEHDFCNFKGSKRVAYGLGDKWTYKRYSDGVACGYKNFSPNEPTHPENIGHALKQCKYFNPWGLCTYEGSQCNFTGTGQVAFGSDIDGWIVKSFSNGVHCNSQQFGRVGFNSNGINKCLILGPEEEFVKPLGLGGSREHLTAPSTSEYEFD